MNVNPIYQDDATQTIKDYAILINWDGSLKTNPLAPGDRTMFLREGETIDGLRVPHTGVFRVDEVRSWSIHGQQSLALQGSPG